MEEFDENRWVLKTVSDLADREAQKAAWHEGAGGISSAMELLLAIDDFQLREFFADMRPVFSPTTMDKWYSFLSAVDQNGDIVQSGLSDKEVLEHPRWIAISEAAKELLPHLQRDLGRSS